MQKGRKCRGAFLFCYIAVWTAKAIKLKKLKAFKQLIVENRTQYIHTCICSFLLLFKKVCWKRYDAVISSQLILVWVRSVRLLLFKGTNKLLLVDHYRGFGHRILFISVCRAICGHIDNRHPWWGYIAATWYSNEMEGN